MLAGMTSARTLATLAPGESGRVGAMRFEALRALWGDLGIREGEEVTCRAGSGGTLILDTAAGQSVAVPRDWARFIALAPETTLAPGAPPAAPAA
jgi:hypothetical protein